MKISPKIEFLLVFLSLTFSAISIVLSFKKELFPMLFFGFLGMFPLLILLNYAGDIEGA